MSRNAAKAKGRDRTTRLQKDFFGKQRMSLMAKGLSGNVENFDDRMERLGPQDISLAHAQRRVQDHSQKSYPRSWIPEPSHIGSSSSPTQSHRSSGKRKYKSKVLRTLDLNERKDLARPQLLKAQLTHDISNRATKLTRAHQEHS